MEPLKDLESLRQAIKQKQHEDCMLLKDEDEKKKQIREVTSDTADVNLLLEE